MHMQRKQARIQSFIVLSLCCPLCVSRELYNKNWPSWNVLGFVLKNLDMHDRPHWIWLTQTDKTHISIHFLFLQIFHKLWRFDYGKGSYIWGQCTLVGFQSQCTCLADQSEHSVIFSREGFVETRNQSRMFHPGIYSRGCSNVQLIYNK